MFEELSNEQLDRLVADKIFGWRVMSNLPQAYCDADGMFVHWRENYQFSTDPAASKQLRDRMRADGWMMQIEDVQLFDTDPRTFRCRIRMFGNGYSFLATANAEERAIALAALRAVGGGPDETC